MKYRAIIFDFDDTLVHTWRAKWQQHKAVAKQFYGIELTDQILQEHWGKPYDDTLRLYYRNSDTLENMRAAKLSLEDRFPVKAPEGVVELLEELEHHGILLTLLSSSTHELIFSDLTRLGYPASVFSIIQGSNDTSVHKPDPAVFKPTLTWFAEQGITMERTLYVGDSVSDYRAAAAAGISFIGVTTGRTSKKDLEAAGTSTIIEQLVDIRDYV